MSHSTVPGIITALTMIAVCAFTGCSRASDSIRGSGDTTHPTAAADVIFYKTTGDRGTLFAKQNTLLSFGTAANQYPIITVDTTQTYQSMDGFGYTLTGGSAQLINGLSSSVRDSLLTELFSTNGNGIGISYLRLSIGASDLSASVFSYDDVATGQQDPALARFSLSNDTTDLIPILRKIISINPSIQLLACPWSAPVWMKTNGSSVGGNLKAASYSVYADYFVKYIQSMQAQGITFHAVTPQNEPLNPGNNPSMVMTAAEQTDFIKNHLGPKLRAAGLATKILAYDHNCDNPQYPLAVLSDAGASAFVDGSAFHLYAGDVSALSTVHNAYPSKNIYFTEQYTAAGADFGGDLAWHVKNLIIGAPRNWSRNVLEWNLASDPALNPHTPGGCTTCLGALTISGNTVTRNVAYYIISHASKFVRPGSVRVGSNIAGSLQNVAYITPEGKKVIIVLNDSNAAQPFNINFRGKWVTATLDAKATGTFIW